MSLALFPQDESPKLLKQQSDIHR